MLEIFNERVQISQSNVLALLRDFLNDPRLSDWYIKEALSTDHLAQSGGIYWIDFHALDQVSVLKLALKSNRIALAEGVDEDGFLQKIADDKDRERVFAIVGTRMQYIEETIEEQGMVRTTKATDEGVNVALVCALPIKDTCRIRIGLTELDPPVTRLIEDLAYHILKETEDTERAESWRIKHAQATPSELIANQATTTQETQSSSRRKRIISAFTSRFDWRYMLLGLFLSVVILAASLIVYPEWSRSNNNMLALLVVVAFVVPNFIANFRKAFETSPPASSAIASNKTKSQKP